MSSAVNSDDFYATLPRVADFEHLTEHARYDALPDDWFVGVADIVDSTGAVAAGRYKTVNMVGAAVVSAMMNGSGGKAFPFVFGGDGAGFAVGPTLEASARQAMSAVARWALTEFDMEMRVALVPVGAVRAAGFDVRVARFQVSDGADYAMFSGGGLSWAEQQMKEGHFTLPPAAEGTIPDLTGLSCRWSHMRSRNGTILSLVIMPEPGGAPDAIAAAYKDIIMIAQGLKRGGHPAPSAGPGSDWPPLGATLEAHAAKGTASLGSARRKALLESFIAWVLIRTGLKIGGFDARHYARVTGENADFRKLDDGLKMTLDCDAETQSRLEAVLSNAAQLGLLRYGIANQDDAMMTCIVPSIMTDDHLHFIDGAAGGYTQAATRMKQR